MILYKKILIKLAGLATLFHAFNQVIFFKCNSFSVLTFIKIDLVLTHVRMFGRFHSFICESKYMLSMSRIKGLSILTSTVEKSTLPAADSKGYGDTKY